MANKDMKLGLEIETLLYFRTEPGKDRNLEQFANYVSKYYNMKVQPGQPKMHADIDGSWDGPEYNEWSLSDDPTIRGGSTKKYPVELISPILRFSANNSWRTRITNMFDILNTICKFEANQSCGFHVHLSPAQGSWALSELKNICMAIIHFEGAFEALVPEHRRANYWAKSNHIDNPRLSQLSSQNIVQKINACTNQVEIAELMNDPDRYFAWNFLNLYHGGKATIEWRQPPPVTTAEGATMWMELVANFISSARGTAAPAGLAKYTKDVAGLEKFVRDGLIAGVSDERYLLPIFKTKYGIIQPRKAAKPNDATMLEKKVKTDKKKNLMMKKLRAELQARQAAQQAKEKTGK